MANKATLLTIMFGLFAFYPSFHAHACDTGNVRSAGFYGGRTIYRLGMVVEDAVEDAHYREIADWFSQHGEGLNVRFDAIDPADSRRLRFEYGISEPLKPLPATVLSAYHPSLREIIVFQQWNPAPPLETLAALKTNPVLEGVRRDAALYWGVLLYSRGEGASRRDALEQAASQWRKDKPPGVAIIEFDRNSADQAWLCAFFGLKPEDEDWAGIVFGQGRLLLPPLRGDVITTAEISRLLNRLAMPCTCLQQASTFLMDIPMFWDRETEPVFSMLESSFAYTEMTLDDKMAGMFEEIPEGGRTLQWIGFATLLPISCLSLLFMLYTWLKQRAGGASP